MAWMWSKRRPAGIGTAPATQSVEQPSAKPAPRRRWKWARRVAFATLGLVAFAGLLVGQVLVSHRSVAPEWMVALLRHAVLSLAPEKLQALVPETLPRQARVDKIRWLDQGWSNAQRFWFHHASQGTALPLPYDWLVALQQPGLTFTGGSNLFRDPEYMRQFGFIPSPRTLQTSADRLSQRYGYPDEEMARRFARAVETHVQTIYMDIKANTELLGRVLGDSGLTARQAAQVTIKARYEQRAEELAKLITVAVTVNVLELMREKFGIDEIEGWEVDAGSRQEINQLLSKKPFSDLRPDIEKQANKLVAELYGDLTTRQMATTSIPGNLQRRMPENIDGLPVGFARTPGFIHPTKGQQLPDQVGFTCAVCHTGELQYQGTSIRIDGGAANVNLGAFQKAFVQAMVYTQKVPGRFGQFADRVLGADHSQKERAKLRQEFDATLAEILAVKAYQDSVIDGRVQATASKGGAGAGERHVAEGFGRLDALNRIGNQVFFTALLPAGQPLDKSLAGFDRAANTRALGFDIGANFARHSAPVSFPPIWNTSWHLWAQYDASIMQPVIRNLGEALGVAAKINMTQRAWPAMGVGETDPVAANALRPLFRSSVDLQDLHDIEAQLAGCRDAFPAKPADPAKPATDPCADPGTGPPGFKGLQAPKWADAARLFQIKSETERRDPAKMAAEKAWSIDPAKMAAGRKLYAEICAECHLPPVRDDKYVEEIQRLDLFGDKRVVYGLWDERTVYHLKDPKDPDAVANLIQGANRAPVIPPPPAPESSRAAPSHWLQLDAKRYLDVVQKQVVDMGTDQALGQVLAGRQIRLPEFMDVNPRDDMNQWRCRHDLPGKSTELGFGIALMAVVDKTAQQWLKDRGKYSSWGDKQKEELQRFLGDRPSCPNPTTEPKARADRQSRPHYRARSLDGVWATAPYLHNGSVPDLWALLSPDPNKDRPETFCTGAKEFDPKRVGFSTRCEPGTFAFDTRIPGNSRFGHELRGTKPKKVPEKGVVGRELSEAERWALIEYLKTL